MIRIALSKPLISAYCFSSMAVPIIAQGASGHYPCNTESQMERFRLLEIRVKTEFANIQDMERSRQKWEQELRYLQRNITPEQGLRNAPLIAKRITGTVSRHSLIL